MEYKYSYKCKKCKCFINYGSQMISTSKDENTLVITESWRCPSCNNKFYILSKYELTNRNFKNADWAE